MFRTLMLIATTAGLAGCSTISSVSTASQTLDAYELSPPLPAAGQSGRRGALYIAPVTASGGLDTDRIAIKPSDFELQYLPGVRWVDRGSEHFGRLLLKTLSASGRFAFVTTETSGPEPDFQLLADLGAFQAEIGPDGPFVRVAAAVTLMDDLSRELRGNRNFEAVVPVADTETATLIAGFDAASDQMLTELAAWVFSRTR